MSFREENYNIMLAELLADRGLKALGEVILRRKGRPTPDVLIELNGIRIILEGKKPGAWEELIKNCEKRLDENLCDLCVMVEYAYINLGSKLSPTQTDIKEALLKGRFNVGFLSYIERANLDRWMGKIAQPVVYQDVDFKELLTYLMSAYDRIVSEDILKPIIDRMNEVLDNFSSGIVSMVDTNRLREILELSDDKSEEGSEND
ncbi:MAG: hypothetical protein QXO75_04595 [Nitrososphaerota archaeon]